MRLKIQRFCGVALISLIFAQSAPQFAAAEMTEAQVGLWLESVLAFGYGVSGKSQGIRYGDGSKTRIAGEKVYALKEVRKWNKPIRYLVGGSPTHEDRARIEGLFTEFSKITQHESGEALNGEELNMVFFFAVNNADARMALEASPLFNSSEVDELLQSDQACIVRRGEEDSGPISAGTAVIRLDRLKSEIGPEKSKTSCVVQGFFGLVGFLGGLAEVSRMLDIPNNDLVQDPFRAPVCNSLAVLYDPSIPVFTMQHEIIVQVRQMLEARVMSGAK